MMLETERLILREFREADFEAVHEYGSDPEVVKYMLWGPNTEQDTREFIRKVLVQQKEQRGVHMISPWLGVWTII